MTGNQTLMGFPSLKTTGLSASIFELPAILLSYCITSDVPANIYSTALNREFKQL